MKEWTQGLIPVRETARRLGVTEYLVRRACSDGELPVVRMGRKLLIPARVVDDLLSGKRLS